MAHDVGHPVFVSDHFYYFGDKRVSIPEKLRDVIKERQGLKKKDGDLARAFVKWLETTYKPGVHGVPRDMRDHRKGEGKDEDRGTCLCCHRADQSVTHSTAPGTLAPFAALQRFCQLSEVVETSVAEPGTSKMT